MTDIPAPLAEALDAQAIELPPMQVQRLDQYCRLLWEWNAKVNLTRHTDYHKFVARDLVDSLQLAALLEADERILDVGTGGGVPGVVLAIVRPDLKVALCESVGKKARAVADMVERMELPIPVHHGRAEAVLEREPFDTLTIRAVARLVKLLRWFKPHRDRFGRLLVVKGPSWVEERGEARHLGLMHDFQLRRAAEYPLPGTESKSVILELRPGRS
jgi:16S rRNA (guanine527-N7)-methyltransferase